LKILDDRSVGGDGSVYLSEPGRKAEIVFQIKSGGENLVLADDEDRHFGFAVDSRQAVDDIAKKARGDGILFFEPDEYLPGAYFCAVRDPNGNCVEFGYGHSVPPV